MPEQALARAFTEGRANSRDRRALFAASAWAKRNAAVALRAWLLNADDE
jgi:hypothetical protein